MLCSFLRVDKFGEKFEGESHCRSSLWFCHWGMKGMCCLGRACLKYSVATSGSFENLSKQQLHSQGCFVVRSRGMGKMSKVLPALPSLPSSTEASLCDSGATCVAVHIKAAHKNHTALTPAPSCWQTHCQLVYETILMWTFFFFELGSAVQESRDFGLKQEEENMLAKRDPLKLCRNKGRNVSCRNLNQV